MSYVYKVQGNFDTINFGDTLEKINEKFLFIYISGDLFVAVRDYKIENDAKYILKKIFKTSNFLITEMSDSILSRQNQQVKDWCVNQMVKLDTDRFQSEKQDVLRDSWNKLDKMENELRAMANDKLEQKSSLDNQ